MGDPRVGLVLVSHSQRLAEGLRELAAQMAPDVVIAVAGGDDEGGLGTSFEKVQAAVEEADGGAGAVVLYDLGSALLTADLVLEILDDEQRERVRVVDAPLVEGAVAAATTAQGGAGLAAVVAAASSAGSGPAPPAAVDDAAAQRARLRLRNTLGLHARPAAELARAVAALDASVVIGPVGSPGVDARSVLGVISLGLMGGAEIDVAATGPQAGAALEVVTRMVEDGFGEDEGL